ncbi:MAG: hypothetical protein J0L93_10865 [Deltaproteobacteria bacterium]|nr:hypothetical protein [Deltaproteobacteria bacterium]
MDASLKSLELDGQVQHFSPEMKFGEISEEIKTKLGATRVLTEIRLDGKSVDLEEEEVLNTKSFKDLGNIVFKTRRIDELFRESLLLAPKICEALRMDCGDVDGFLAKGEVREAHQRVSEMTSLMEWLLQLIAGMQSLGNDKLEDIQFTQGKVMDSVNRMQTLLASLHVHLAGEKWNEFRAVLQGDFFNEVGVWQILFEDVSKTWNPKSSLLDS